MTHLFLADKISDFQTNDEQPAQLHFLLQLDPACISARLKQQAALKKLLQFFPVKIYDAKNQISKFICLNIFYMQIESNRNLVDDMRIGQEIDLGIGKKTDQNLGDNSGQKKSEHVEDHIDAGEILKSLVYGGVDGTINALIIVLTGIIADETAKSIMAFSLSVILGDGISMGMGDYLSARAEIQYIKAEEARELYEVEHLLNDEKKEIIDIYLEKGYTIDDCNRIADLLATNTQAFVNVMMLEELKLVVVDQKLALKCGVATLISFMVLGVIPVLPYIIGYGAIGSEKHYLGPVLAIGVVELFSLGFAKASIIGLNPWKSGLQTLVLGVIVTGIACGLGKALE